MPLPPGRRKSLASVAKPQSEELLAALSFNRSRYDGAAAARCATVAAGCPLEEHTVPHRRALLTTIPSDSHNWNLVFLEALLGEVGFEVENLGVCVPVELVADACERVAPSLVVVSTANGHGTIECAKIAERLARLPARDRMRLFAGGKLMLTEEEAMLARCIRRLRAAGFDRIFCGPDSVGEFRRALSDWFGVPGALAAPAAAEEPLEAATTIR